MRPFIFFMALFLTFSEVSAQTRNYWPTDVWQTKTLAEVDMDTAWIKVMDAFVLQNYAHLHCMLIVKDGYLVFEKYYYTGYGKDDYHILCSATKSITSILIGMLYKQGFIDSLGHPIIDYFPEYDSINNDPRLNDLTIEHMLTFTSGLDHDDDYTWQTADIIKTYLGRAFLADPGTRFHYETPASQVLSAIVNKTTGKSARNFADSELFPVLGISNFYWPSDGLGYTYGGYNSYFTPRDMLKMGFLYLNHGVWDGDTIVDPAYVATSTIAHTDGGNPHKEKYGYNWWVTSVDCHHTYFAGGYGGQFILVIPDLDLVVVTTSALDKHHEENRYLVNDYIVPAIKHDPLSIKQKTTMGTSVSIFPNPTTGLITISGFAGAKQGAVDLVDPTGNVLQRLSCNSPDMTLDLSAYPKGIYLIKISNDDLVITKRVMRY